MAFTWTVNRRLVSGSVAALALLGAVGGVAYVNTGSLVRTQGQVSHTYQVLEAVATIDSDLKDAETGQRGFLITGQPRYLAPYEAALAATEGHIDAVARLTSDNPRQQARIATLRPLVAAKFAELKATIELRRSAGFAAAQAVVLTDKGKAVMDQIRADLAAMDHEERSLLSVRSAATASAARATRTAVLLGWLVGLVLLGGIGLLLSRTITRPLVVLAGRLGEIADGDGDLTQRVDESRRDEIGTLGANFNRFVSKIATTIGEIAGTAETLTAAAEGLTTTNNVIADSAARTSGQAEIVSSAAEQINASVQTVASGAEQMGASIREIAQNASDAARVAASAVQSAQSANETVGKLGDSSAEISTVIKTITAIAQQTNLLALNATIEAARAGEAGKGFAVVANEVKELAQETARATEDISRRIEAIQTDTGGAVEAIAQIGSVIGQINDYTTTISAAVEEQTATTSEMARSVNEAATGSGHIADNIGSVSQAAQSTTTGIADNQQATGELTRMAGELRTIVGQFRF